MKNKKFRVLIADLIKPPAEVERKVLGSNVEIIAANAKVSSEIPDTVWKSCDAVIGYDALEFDKQLIKKLDKCKIISRAGIGYDNVDLLETRKKGIFVCNIPDYCTEEVADHTLALLLGLMRGISEYTESVKERRWKRESSMVYRLRGKTIGIIGLGRIGSSVAKRAKVLGLNVIYYDPYIKDAKGKKLGVKRVKRLTDIAKNSNIITIHTPLTKETEKMISTEFFNNTKKGAYLINTARGRIIDIKALEKAMKSDIIKACGLDVIPIEPSNNSQKLIVDYEKGKKWLKGRLMVTPHSAFFSNEAIIELRTKSAMEAKRVLDGGKPLNCVNGL